MLKKTLLLMLVMVVAITAVMADAASQQSAAVTNAKEGYSEGSPVMDQDTVSYYPSAYTVVSLNTKSASSASVKVAFSGSNTMPENDGGSKKTVNLTLLDDGTASNTKTGAEDALYAVWDISYGGKLDISLGINKELTGETNTGNALAWKATAKAAGSGSDATVSSNTNTLAVQKIAEHDGTGDSIKSTNNRQIEIVTTESATGYAADTFSANLYLIVSDQSA